MTAYIVTTNADKSFYYLGCSVCKTKMQTNICRKCQVDRETRAIYSFSLMVSDGTGSLWLHVFDSLAQRLIGKTSDELKALQDSGNYGYRSLINALNGSVSSWHYRR